MGQHTPLNHEMPPDRVREQLSKIVDSTRMIEADRLKSLLIYIVEQTLVGNAFQLKGYTIGVEVFKKPIDFDPQADAIVRVQVGRLRNILENYYLDEGKHDSIKIEIPKGSYIPVFKVYEGLQEIDQPGLNKSKPRVGVLPFLNISFDAEQEYFSEGITEEIITSLTRFKDIAVLSRFATSKYKNQKIDIVKLGNDLELSYLLQGSVQKAGNRLRVTAQLLDVENAENLWAESYDCELSIDNIFEIQDSISSQIVSKIAQPYGVISNIGIRKLRKNNNISIEAYDAVLHTYHYFTNLNEVDHKELRALLEQATQYNPGYSDAWACLSYMYGDEYRYGFNVYPEQYDCLSRCLECAQKAVDLDTENATAYHALAVAFFLRRDIPLFKAAAERALALNPYDSNVLSIMGCYLSYSGEWERGLQLMQQACDININHPDWYFHPFFYYHYFNGRYTTALSYALKFKLKKTKFFWNYVALAMIYGQLGEIKEAHQAIKQLLLLKPDYENCAIVEFEKWNFSDNDIHQCVDGLNKAGLQIKVNTLH